MGTLAIMSSSPSFTVRIWTRELWLTWLGCYSCKQLGNHYPSLLKRASGYLRPLIILLCFSALMYFFLLWGFVVKSCLGIRLQPDQDRQTSLLGADLATWRQFWERFRCWCRGQNVGCCSNDLLGQSRRSRSQCSSPHNLGPFRFGSGANKALQLEAY